MIRVEGVRKTFEGRVVLDGVTTTFERGKVSLVTGPSGGGKSTLLRCINGLERFDEGRIVVGDRTIGPPPRARSKRDDELLRAVRRSVGMVFQHFGLFAHRTALGNVMEAPVHVRNVPTDEAREQACRLLERVGLSHRRDAFPHELSGGEQQRVAIARALAMQPEALLLDEPTSALDPERKRDVVAVLRDLARDGTTMVIVTHEAAILADLADRVTTLRSGRVDG